MISSSRFQSSLESFHREAFLFDARARVGAPTFLRPFALPRRTDFACRPAFDRLTAFGHSSIPGAALTDHRVGPLYRRMGANHLGTDLVSYGSRYPDSPSARNSVWRDSLYALLNLSLSIVRHAPLTKRQKRVALIHNGAATLAKTPPLNRHIHVIRRKPFLRYGSL